MHITSGDYRLRYLTIREKVKMKMLWTYPWVPYIETFSIIVEDENIKNSMFCALFQNRMKLVPGLNMTFGYTKLPGGKWFGYLETRYSHFPGILQSNPLYGKISNFIFADMQKWVTPMKRAWKTDQENGMVYYTRMYGSRDIKI